MTNSPDQDQSQNIEERANPPEEKAITQPLPQRSGGVPMQTVMIGAILAVAIVGSAGAYFLLGHKEAEKKKDRAFPVTVATASTGQIALDVRVIGNVVPYSVVNITPQVNGQLAKVYFKQGDFVKKGQLLFSIDPRPYQASHDQALGNVAKDKAQVEVAQANEGKDEAQIGQLTANLNKDRAQYKFSKTERGRYNDLAEEGAVSHEQSDQMSTNATEALETIRADKKAIENAKAVVKADQAQIQTAKGTLAADQGAAENTAIQLGWTQIRSPLDGRAGSLNVYEGNVVTASSGNPIVTINQVQPIYVSVTVPEQYLDNIRRAQGNGTLKMQAMIEGKKTDAVDGTISFLENAVNTNTGTIMLRAAFNNPSQKLYPGQFVDAILSMPPSGETIVVPARSIQTTQQGLSVFVVNKDNRVHLRPIEVGESKGGHTAVLKGVSAGDVVVVDGQMNLTDGILVQIQK